VPEKDLLPPGSPFVAAARRSLDGIEWLNHHQIAFAMACGTGCLGYYTVNADDGRYEILCIGRGDLFWRADHTKAVIENEGGGGMQGLGIVQLSNAVPLNPGESAFQYDRECKSAFEGETRLDWPGEYPEFNGWFPDGQRVLYSEEKKLNLRVWDTQNGVRSTLFRNASTGSLSLDSKKISLLVLGKPVLDAQGRLIGGSTSFDYSAEPKPPNFLCLIDANSRKVLSMAQTDTRAPYTCSPDGRNVLSFWHGKRIIISADQSDRRAHYLTLPDAKYSWSPTGKWLVAFIEPSLPQPSGATSPHATGHEVGPGIHAAPEINAFASRPQPETTSPPSEKSANLYILQLP
jgi:hypothetical protein